MESYKEIIERKDKRISALKNEVKRLKNQIILLENIVETSSYCIDQPIQEIFTDIRDGNTIMCQE